MPDKDLNILVQTQIDQSAKAVQDINNQIRLLSNKLEKLDLKIDIDPTVISTLDKFANVITNVSKVTNETNKVIKTEEEILRKLDGTIEKVTRQYFQNGEIIEKTSKEKIEKINKEEKAVENLSNEYGKLIKTVERRNAQGEPTGKELTFRNQEGLETTAYFNAGEETASKVVNNIERIERAEEKSQQEIRNAFIETERKRRQELEKSEKAQANAINKNLEQEYKRKQGLGELIGSYDSLKKAQVTEIDLADVLSKKYQQQEIREISLDRTTGRYTATIKKNAKENIVLKGTLDKTTGSLYKQSEAFRETNARNMGFMEQFKVALTRVPVWMGAMTVFWGSIRSFQTGFQYITDIDTAITDLRKVVDETTGTLHDFTLEANQMGKELGTTTDQIIKATTNFARMGYNLEQAKEIARTAIITQSVGDLQSVDDASKYLIATMKAYDIEAEKSLEITDKLNQVSNRHALTVQDISEGLMRSANSMQLANASIDQTIALVTGAQTVTQRGGDVVGNALRTLAARLYGVGDAEEEVVPTLEKDLQAVGVEIRDVTGNFRNIYDVLKDLAKVFPQIDQITQQSLLEGIAGKRQREILAALLTNFSEVEQAYQDSLSSTGSAMEEFADQQQSIEYRLQQFSNAAMGFWQHALDTQSFKDFIDLGTNFLELLTKMVDNFGLLPPVVAVATTAFFLLNRKALSATIEQMTLLPIKLKTLNLQLKETGVAATIASSALSGLRAITMALLPVAIITGISYGIQKIVQHYTDLKRETEAINKTQSDFNDTLKEFNDTLNPSTIKELEINLKELKDATNYEENIKRIDELKQQIKELEKVARASENSSELATLQMSRTELAKLEEKVKSVTQSEKEYIRVKELSNALDYKAQQQVIVNIANKIKEIDEERELIEKYEQSIKKGEEDLAIKEQLIDKYPQYLEFLDDNKNKVELNTSAIKNNINIQETLAKAEIVTAQTSMRASYEKTQAVLSDTLARINALESEKKVIELLAGVQSNFNETFGFSDNGFAKWQENQSKNQTKNIENELQQQKLNLLKLQETLNIQKSFIEMSPDELLNAYSSSNIPVSNTATSTPSSQPKDIDQFQSTQNKAIEDLNTLLVQSEGRLSKYNETSQEYRDELQNQIDLQQQLQEEYHKQANNLRERNKEILNDPIYKKGLKNFNDLSSAQKEMFNELAKELEDNDQAINGWISSWWTAEKSVDDSLKNIVNSVKNQFEEMQNTMEEVIGDISSIYKEFYDIQIDLEEKRHKGIIDDLDDELDKYEEIINAKLKLLDETENESKYQKELAKLQEERQDIQNQLNILALDDSIEAKAKREELEKTLADKTNEIQEKQHDHTIDLRRANLQDQLDNYQKEIEAKKDAEDKKYNAEIERLKDLAEQERAVQDQILSGSIDGIESQLDIFRNYITENMDIIGSNIGKNLIEKIDEAKIKLQDINDVKFDELNGQFDLTGAIIKQMEANSIAWHSASERQKEILHAINLELAELAGLQYDSASGAYKDEKGNIAYTIPKDNNPPPPPLPKNNTSSSLGKGAAAPGTPAAIANETKLKQDSSFVAAEKQRAKEVIENRKKAGLDTSTQENYLKHLENDFHSGGIVGGKGDALTELINKMVNVRPGEQLVKALNGELFIPPRNIPNLATAMAGSSSTNNVYNLNFRIDKLTGDKNGANLIVKETLNALKKIGR